MDSGIDQRSPADKLSGQPLIRARGLTKYFNGRPAVQHIDFDIDSNEIVGFLGPNGAGKTTTIRMLLNLLNPTDGELEIFGLTYAKNRVEILRQMNASSANQTLPGKLTVLENLRVFSDLYGMSSARKRIDELINKFDLDLFLNRPLYALSSGQQVRVSLAKSFLNKPRLLLLDEPTANLDPEVADRVRSLLLRAVGDEETTVFLTSHNMLEVQKLCSRVIFLNAGRIQDEGSPQELAKRLKRWSIHIVSKNNMDHLPEIPLPEKTDLAIDQRHLKIETDRSQVGRLLSQLIRHGVEIDQISIHEPTLEDFFVRSARGTHDQP